MSKYLQFQLKKNYLKCMCHTLSPLNYMTANNSSFKYKRIKMYILDVSYALANIIEPTQQS